MKKILIFSIILSTIHAYSQQTTSTSLETVPVSPEAASLGKYGDLPVNLASGRLNFTIPIYTIQIDDFEVPIYLSYNHSGLLAEEDPGLVGLGWTLHAGGRVIRNLQGKPDEKSGLGYLGGDIGTDWVVPYCLNEWSNLSDIQKKEKKFNLFDMSDSGRADTQSDKFTINAAGLSGNFSFNSYGNPIFTPHKNYKVTFDNNFKITDDTGIQYFFDDPERSFLESLPEDINNIPYNYISGWGLTSIILPNSGQEISFEYESGKIYNKTSYTESRSVLMESSGLGIADFIKDVNSVKQSGTRISIAEKRQISKISFPEGYIMFEINEVPSGSFSTSKEYLQSITIYDKFDKKINSYTFTYDNLMSNFKLLTEVKKFDQHDEQEPFYKLAYNGTPPLEIDYKSQDTWGYYNGKNNLYLITGDRSVDVSKSSLGALQKITYPTKGYTEINYESNKVSALDPNYEELPFGGQCYTTPINATETVFDNDISYGNAVKKTINITHEQVIRVTLNAFTDDGQGIAESRAKIKLVSGDWDCNPHSTCNTNGCSTMATSVIEMGNHSNDNTTEQFFYFVEAESVIEIEANLEGSFNMTGNARVIIEYFDPSIISENDFVDIGGIRVSSTKDCSGGNDCVVKNYNYIKEDGSPSGKILTEPKYSYDTVYTYRFSTTDLVPAGSANIRYYFSNSRIPFSSFQGSPVLYDRVEVLKGSDNRIEKTVKYFTSYLNEGFGFPFPPSIPKDWKNGQLHKLEIFKKQEDQYLLVKKIENNYEVKYPYPESATNYFSYGVVAKRKEFNYVQLNEPSEYILLTGNPTHYESKYYYYRPEFYHLASTTETSYFPNHNVSKETLYDYDTVTGYLTEQSSLIDGHTIKDKQYYYNHIENIPGMSTSEISAIQKLQQQNRISKPLRTEKYKNNTKLSTLHHKFKDWGNQLVLPEKIMISKGNSPFEDQTINHSYYPNGNIKEISKSKGMRTVYIWGYNNTKIIAEIKNAKYTQVQNFVSNLQNLSNLDTNAESESNLRDALDSLRNEPELKHTLITTYTHDPLVGITSITDPRRETTYYTYDNFGRLEYIKDANHKILLKKEYNYKN
jgi:YD repeat-containing protein